MKRVIQTPATVLSAVRFLGSMIHSIIKGAPMMPSMLIKTVLQTRKVAAWSTSSLVSTSPWVFLYSDSSGTKAWAKAPSANRRRSMLGRRNATVKASM